MLFETKHYTNTIDLSSNEGKQQAGIQIRTFVKPLIDGIIETVSANTFDYSTFSFSKQQSSNANLRLRECTIENLRSRSLTEKNGLYLIINKKTKRIYLGGTSNLAQRKGDHKRTFTNENKITKLTRAMREDLRSGSFEDFYFVPLVIIHDLFLDNKQALHFLDQYVEGPLLDEYFLSGPDVFYNIKTVGPFQKGNKFGGSPNSGSPSQPVSYTTTILYRESLINSQIVTYAWESVSAAAKTFNVTTKLIRVKINQCKMVKLDRSEYQSFTGIKISNQNVKEGQKVIGVIEYNQILLELFPYTANKNK